GARFRRLATSLAAGRRVEAAWVAFAVLNLAGMGALIVSDAPAGWETVPFHFVYVSFTILFGFRAWRARGTMAGIVFVSLTTGLMTYVAIRAGREAWAEETEVPLMSL